ncbi:MAG: hypothetical protein WCK84_09800 [Bacteroidota bacterium]
MKKSNIFLLITALLMLPFILSAQEVWPRKFSTDWAKVVVYQPEPDSIAGDHLYLRSAISIITKTSKSPAFGAIWMDAQYTGNKEKGICTVNNVKLLNVRFPAIDTLRPSELKRFDSLFEKEASAWKMEYSFDALKSALDLTSAALGTNLKLKNDPPEIIYLDRQAILLLFDGDPFWKETGSEGIKRAVNTPCLVLQDTKENSYYLYGDLFWYKASDPIKSQWTSVAKPSLQVQHYLDAQKKEATQSGKSAAPVKKKSANLRKASPQDIVVRTKPAELILSYGEAEFTPIKGTQLLYMKNTENNIFMTIDKNQYYVLLSGRWYRTDALAGPWIFIEPNKLPADFAKIPKGSAKDIVLASVAGTDAAKTAILDASIPKTSAVNRKTAKCEVKWDGDPKFETIKGTELTRGLNTSSAVLLYKNSYFVCDNGAWFTGKSPSGPWEVATSVPGEIQKIPPDNPAYNVKYVYIYQVKPDVVYIGYTPGYTGTYVAGHTVVYGTGYTYSPFYDTYYYPRPSTFGYSMIYNPWVGWSMGFSMSMGLFAASLWSSAAWYGGWWGPSSYWPYYGGYCNSYYGSNSYSYYEENNNINIYETNIYESRDPGETEELNDLEDLDDMNYLEDPNDPDDQNVADDQVGNDDQVGQETQDDQNVQDNSDDNVEPDNQDNSGNNEAPETPDPPDPD